MTALQRHLENTPWKSNFLLRPPDGRMWRLTAECLEISDGSRRSFVVGLLVRCGSVPVLENIQSSLRLTSWNLLSFAPTKGKTLPELYARLDCKTRPSPLIREIWEWFDRSPEWVQTRYLCLLLLQCDPELLSMANNLIGVVVTRLQRQLDGLSLLYTWAEIENLRHEYVVVFLQMWPFEAAYANIKTRSVRMEERNIYCGAYFTSVLIDSEDPHRVVDYKGGPMLSSASKDRAVRLLYVGTATKQVGLMKGHVGSIRVVLLCPERHLVITASCDTSIRCWSVRTDQCVLVLYGHSSMINCLDIHADRLVSGAKDCTAKVWSLQTEKHLEDFNFKHRSSVRCVKINATAVFSSCDRGVVKLWDAENASLLRVRVIDAHNSAVRCMFVDEWHLLSADTNGQVMAWSSRCETKGCLMTVSHPKEVKSLTLAYLRVVTGCVDGKIRIFNFLTGDCLRTIVVEAETTGRMLSNEICMCHIGKQSTTLNIGNWDMSNCSLDYSAITSVLFILSTRGRALATD
uniref:Uncharacterized protein n=1 Tax=Hippocampus comes TaxID=109280 RepID=A0A3Q2XC20_HIPCM